MNFLRNTTTWLFGGSSKETIADITSGQLYLVRPRSPKGYSELIFPNAAASIRKTGQDFQYQLVIQRVFEEGEEDLRDEEDADDEVARALGSERYERTFLMDEAIRFRIETSDDTVLAWRDLSGDEDDLYQFICDDDISQTDVKVFEDVALKAQYERKYRKSSETATDAELERFNFSAQPIPSASPLSSPTSKSAPEHPNLPSPPKSGPNDVSTRLQQLEITPELESAPPSKTMPSRGQIMHSSHAELFLFNLPTEDFQSQAADVIATISDLGKWQYWLQISDSKQDWMGIHVNENINPVFNFEHKSFIFNHFLEDGSAYSWLLKFQTEEKLGEFQESLMQALWEHLNEIRWIKAEERDKQYVLDAFQDITMEDQDYVEEEEESEEAEVDDGQRSEHYDSDESDDDVEAQPDDGNVNSQLAVGYKHDRSFVVRGSKIGVFKHTPNNNLEFSTNISKVETPKGKLFSPKKVMLHAEDSNMILQNEADPNSLYRLDLEYGKIVDEWKVHDDIPVTTFAPEKKFAQMTGEQTFLGLSKNALYRIDPRIAGNKLVESELKQYASKNEFSTAATTEKGYIAVASNKGDIRMFDRLGINAKTVIPALGEAIIGVDVSADGRWILATCKTYLLLIDAEQKDGKWEGKLGFEKSFAKDKKPTPRRLCLAPAHVAQFQHETKQPLSFTPAKFNAGLDNKETSIVTATGPFIVTWNMKKVLAGRKDPYTIKRYAEEVKADNFKFGSDKNVIVALPNEVNMVAKQSFKKPTRESIATPARTSRTSGRMSSNMRRSDVVKEY